MELQGGAALQPLPCSPLCPAQEDPACDLRAHRSDGFEITGSFAAEVRDRGAEKGKLAADAPPRRRRACSDLKTANSDRTLRKQEGLS